MTSLQEIASEHRNYDRARAFRGPVFRSAAPAAMLIGYSVTSEDDVDVLIEANHVVEAGAETDPQPVSVRTRNRWNDADAEWENDILDSLMTHRLDDVASERERILGTISSQERRPITITMNGRSVDAEAIDVDAHRFVRVLVDKTVLVTVSGPRAIADAPLTDDVPE